MSKKAQRRNVLETPPNEEQSSMWRQMLSQIADPEQLSERERPAERKREWEAKHRPKHYRGVPAAIRQEVKQIAEDLTVTVDEVARAFLEYGLHCIQRGTLKIEGTPSFKRQRMTLYPFEGAAWAENGWTPQPPKRNRRAGEKGGSAQWQEIAHYRLPDELHLQIKRLAGDNYPVGEVVTVLLKHGIESYKQGVLVLMPKPKTASFLDWTRRER